MINIAFYVSGNAGRLREIIKHTSDEFYNTTKLIVCDNKKNDDLKHVLANTGITFFSFDYEQLHCNSKIRSKKLSDLLLLKFLDKEIDYCFCFGDHILKGDLLIEYKNKIINFHPSILPGFPGRKAIDQALNSNSILLGNTAHFIDEGIDTGPIIMQSILSKNYFKKNGYNSILNHQVTMYGKILDCLKKGLISIDNENNVLIQNADYSEVILFPNI